MIKQLLSDKYDSDVETKELIEELFNYFGQEEGIIFYKFPTVKLFDKEPVLPDVFIVSESIGVFTILVDTVITDRESNIEELINKVEDVDNYIYTTLLKNRNLQLTKRSLKVNIETIAYCPFYQGDNTSIHVSINSVLNLLAEIKKEERRCSSDEIQDVVTSLEGSGAMIKRKERVLTDEKPNTKARLLKEIETSIARFDDEQRFSALSTMEGPQRIRGLAGSGKTIILCLKAANLHMMYPDANILYTFYTRSLYDYIVQLINRFYMKMTDGQLPNYNKIQVLHAWGGRQVPGVYYEACKSNGIVPLTYYETRDYSNPFDYVCKKFIDDTKNDSKKIFDYVLMDEAQDFEASFYQLCRSIVKNDRLVWCYDEVQNIFDVVIQNTKDTFSNKYDKEGIDLLKLQSNHPAIQNDIVLHKSYRNVRKILILAVSLGFGIYNERLIQSLENNKHWEDLGFRVISGDCSKEEDVVIERLESASPLLVDETKLEDCVSLYEAPTFVEEIEWIVNCIETSINEDGLLPEDIAVICVDKKNIMTYMNCLESMLAAKGIGTYNVLDRNYVKGFYREDKVTLSSVFKAKGNEAAMVFVCGCHAFGLQANERNMRNKIFTSFTRAKVWLRISGFGENSMKQMIYELNKLKEHDFKYCFKNKPTHMLDKDWNERDDYRIKEEEIILNIEREAKRMKLTVDEYLNIASRRKSNEGKHINE